MGMVDVLTGSINFALQKVLDEYENSSDKNDKIIYEMAKRSKTLWENVNVHGLQTIGLTYGQYCEQFKEKKNILFLTDSELADFKHCSEKLNLIREKINDLKGELDNE